MDEVINLLIYYYFEMLLQLGSTTLGVVNMSVSKDVFGHNQLRS